MGVVAAGPRHQAQTLSSLLSWNKPYLGHISNAEDEKIRKICAWNRTNAEILKINDSAADMTKAIPILEIGLQTNCGLFEDRLCGPQCKVPKQSTIEKE